MSDGYLGNQHLKKTGVPIEWTPELIQEYAKCAVDPVYFAKKYIKIVHVDRGLVPFEMYPYQEQIVREITDNRRVAVLTARQSGKTTTAVAIILHYILFNEFKTVAVLANKGDAAREVLSRVQLAYESLPKWLQQGILEWNKGSIELENGCKIYAGTTSSSAIRGKSVSFLYLDECVEGDTKVCVELCNNHYYYGEISSFVNIDESKFIEVEDNMNTLYTVYRTINKINNKQYIGFHKVKSPEEILCNSSISGSIYKDGYLGSGKLIKRAIEKYKPANLRQELLFVTNDIDEAKDTERFLVDNEYVLREDTYNIATGGGVYVASGPNNGFFGKKHTPETIKKIQSKRNITMMERPFSSCTIYDTASGDIMLNYAQVYEYYNIPIEDRDRHSIHMLAYYGAIKYSSDILNSRAIHAYERFVTWIMGAETRAIEKSLTVSKRFKGVSKTAESNAKRSESIKDWARKNPNTVKARNDITNRNPEKIRKTAENHRGMKRSEETRKKISEALTGKPAPNKGNVYIRELSTGSIRAIQNGEDIPDGWVRGTGYNSGPKGKKAFFNPTTSQISFFIPGLEPTGWRLGRK